MHYLEAQNLNNSYEIDYATADPVCRLSFWLY
jgi:hypothetical protein